MSFQSTAPYKMRLFNRCLDAFDLYWYVRYPTSNDPLNRSRKKIVYFRAHSALAFFFFFFIFGIVYNRRPLLNLFLPKIARVVVGRVGHSFFFDDLNEKEGR